MTELENCALAVIWRLQPCSAYDVRRNFATSPSSEWSASAGSVYPLIERLIRARLVRRRAVARDTRGRSDLFVTAAGQSAIRAWLTDLEPWTGQSTMDPIRSRMHFLDFLLHDSDRKNFLDRAEALTDQSLQNLARYVENEKKISEINYLASLGAIYELRARKQWLRKVRRALFRS